MPDPVSVYRYAAPLLGIVSQGTHLTVYTRTSSGLRIWVPRRSPIISAFPSKLDSTVGAGVTAGTTQYETIVREVEGEVSLPGDVVKRDIRLA